VGLLLSRCSCSLCSSQGAGRTHGRWSWSTAEAGGSPRRKGNDASLLPLTWEQEGDAASFLQNGTVVSRSAGARPFPVTTQRGASLPAARLASDRRGSLRLTNLT